eukprot:CAMPEP_0182798022 /NCGR_PEP_ID=MMETSP0006_2-20121128/1131_1 /TAXON_ID=97485 /ORGANISM="Prymnesium parvum, Strain Texoma1" /LENGTH=57 /DNA_ID=CAMNT_0024923117 /DNA_START=305 /DNA_END=475 /DNA_ORIENTATION=+
MTPYHAGEAGRNACSRFERPFVPLFQCFVIAESSVIHVDDRRVPASMLKFPRYRVQR